MRRTPLFILTLAAIVATAILTLYGHPVWSVVAALVALIAAILFYRSAINPLRVISTATSLVRSQDFASRLRHVGEKETDEIVDFYNDIMGKMKQERLKNIEQTDLLWKLIEASPAGILICGLSGEPHKSNPAFSRLVTPELTQHLRSLEIGEKRTFQREGGELLRCSCNFFMDRGFRRKFYTVERITEEVRRAEKQLFEKIVRTMSHEINNILAGVVSVLESLEDIHADEADIATTISSCRNSCGALGRFVAGYSEIVKLPAGVLREGSVAEAVESALPMLRHICGDTISLDIDTAGASTVMLDQDLIERVLVNAVKNSSESIAKRQAVEPDYKGEISISCNSRQLVITDNGSGISPEDSQRVFTPFFSTKHPDRGLGLMLIADILRIHNASFSLSTFPDDRLTRLSVTFPD